MTSLISAHSGEVSPDQGLLYSTVHGEGYKEYLVSGGDEVFDAGHQHPGGYPLGLLVLRDQLHTIEEQDDDEHPRDSAGHEHATQYVDLEAQRHTLQLCL